MYFAFNVTCWESFYVYVFRWNYTFGGGMFTTFADFIGHLSLCFLLKHERYSEHFLEMMLHVFIDMLSIYVNMYSLI